MDLLRDVLMAEWDEEAKRVIEASTLIQGEADLTQEVLERLRSSEHEVVFVADVPVILTAFPEQADMLASSAHLKAMVAGAGRRGVLRSGRVHGRELDFSGTVSCVSCKEVGSMQSSGPVLALVLDDPNAALAQMLVLFTDLAQSLDPMAPATPAASAARLMELAEALHQEVAHGQPAAGSRRQDEEAAAQRLGSMRRRGYH